MKNQINKIAIITFFLATIILPDRSFAISAKIISNDSSYQTNTDFYVDVLIDTEGLNINGVDGKVSVSKNADVVRVEDGGSIVKNWLVRPESKNIISFSGITPNGFNGYLNSQTGDTSGLLFRIVLSSKDEGLVTVDLKDLIVTQNDGLGTVVSIKNKSLGVNISNSATSSEYVLIDNEKPEVFYEITSSKDLFNGQKVLVFMVVDSKSGFNTAYIKEGNNDFKPVSSPYLLEDQSFRGIILLKVVDNAGNESLVKIKPDIRTYLSTMTVKIGLGLALLIILLITFYAKKTRKGFKKL